jgi:hypothetical protein
MDVTIENRIDSLIYKLSISSEIPKWEDKDTAIYATSQRIPPEKIEFQLDSLEKCINLAYYRRLRFRPALEGNVKFAFTITSDCENRNISVLESTLDDKVMEYSILWIIKMIIPRSCYRTEPANVIHEMTFGKSKRIRNNKK